MQKRKKEGIEKHACLILSFETGPKTEHEMVWPCNHMVAVVQPPTDAVVEGSLLSFTQLGADGITWESFVPTWTSCHIQGSDRILKTTISSLQ
ncbi:hypothetical protein V6N11_006364 [Hibiscus sabdariffa]|uniref:Uncharacterized protein n=1 Tax=Hibiscus sabdariffa TaxID=183260 RepID=A0ABR2RR24_9ROSI